MFLQKLVYRLKIILNYETFQFVGLVTLSVPYWYLPAVLFTKYIYMYMYICHMTIAYRGKPNDIS